MESSPSSHQFSNNPSFLIHHQSSHQHQHQHIGANMLSSKFLGLPDNKSSLKKESSRVSIDAGYESLLSSNSFLSNSGYISGRLSTAPTINEPDDESLSSPYHTARLLPTSSMSPDFNQHIVDVDSIYYQSIKHGHAQPSVNSIGSSVSSLSLMSCSSASPFKTGIHFDQFSASSSNSPAAKLSQSPKFASVAFSRDQYVHERNVCNNKLLRSPSFKLNPTAAMLSEQRPEIRSFQSRFAMNYSLSATHPPPLHTETELDFAQVLIRNKLLPANPEFLIGRRMGEDHVDMLAELNGRSMFNIIDRVLGFMQDQDLVNIGGVTREWRGIVTSNKRLNRRREHYLRVKRAHHENFKENRRTNSKCVGGGYGGGDGMNWTKMSAADKRLTFSRSSHSTNPMLGIRNQAAYEATTASAATLDFSEFPKNNVLSMLCPNRLSSSNAVSELGISSKSLFKELKSTGPAIISSLLKSSNTVKKNINYAKFINKSNEF